MSLTPPQLASSHDIWLPLSLRTPAKRAIVRRSRSDDVSVPYGMSAKRLATGDLKSDIHPSSHPCAVLGRMVSSLGKTSHLRQHCDEHDWIRRGWLEGMLLDLISGEIRFVVCFMVPEPIVTGLAKLRYDDSPVMYGTELRMPPSMVRQGSNQRPMQIHHVPRAKVLQHVQVGLSTPQTICLRRYAIFSAAQIANYCWVECDYASAPVQSPSRE